MALEIRKESQKVWLHVPTDGDEFIFSKFYCKAVGQKFRVVEFGGSIKKEYPISEVSVYDIGGTQETFLNAKELMQRLEALGYTGFFTDGEVTPSGLISTQVDNALTLGSDGKLFVPESDKFLELNSISILSSGWLLSGGIYEYQYTNINITESSIVDIVPDNSSYLIVSSAQILPRVDTFNGSLKIYSNNLPSGNFNVTIIINRN